MIFKRENSDKDATKDPFLAILSPETPTFPIINCRSTTQNAGELVNLVNLDFKCFAVDPEFPCNLVY